MEDRGTVSGVRLEVQVDREHSYCPVRVKTKDSHRIFGDSSERKGESYNIKLDLTARYKIQPNIKLRAYL